jgi:hypothetical protein
MSMGAIAPIDFLKIPALTIKYCGGGKGKKGKPMRNGDLNADV